MISFCVFVLNYLVNFVTIIGNSHRRGEDMLVSIFPMEGEGHVACSVEVVRNTCHALSRQVTQSPKGVVRHNEKIRVFFYNCDRRYLLESPGLCLYLLGG